MTGTPLIEVEGLSKAFPVGRTLTGKPRRLLHAVSDVSLAIARGETLGLVGESGCGKSTLGRLAIRLIEPDSGTIRFEGRDIGRLDRDALRPLRPKFQMVFQDPLGSLDPRMRIADSIAEPLTIAGRGGPAERREKARAMLQFVGLSPDHAARFPHEFSGGQRQRICIARALIVEPALIVADEPVSALDVSVRAQIINLFQDLQDRFGLTYLFISHDLGVVRHVADRVAVMYLGRIVEEGRAKDLLDRPLHPYTRALVAAVPPTRPTSARRPVVEGDPPSPLSPPPGCAFHPRCPLAGDRCLTERPHLREAEPSRAVACHAVAGT